MQSYETSYTDILNIMRTRCGGLLSLLLALSAILLFEPDSVRAASLYIDPSTEEIHQADAVTFSVRADTEEDECINTVDAVITYDEGIHAVDISRGRSILTLWVEDPVIDADNRTITFAGGIPNGYCGRIPGDPSLTNVVAEIVFRVPGLSIGRKETSTARINFAPETRILLNDGLGSEAPLRTIGSEVTILDRVATSTSNTWLQIVNNDEQLPEEFGVTLVQDQDVFSGRYYIVFSTTDKQSGIDRYEVIEESLENRFRFLWGRSDLPWVEAKSPYVLRDQSLNSTIRVRAIDKAGNERVAVLVPEEALRDDILLIPLFVSVGVLLIGIIAGVLFFFFNRRRKNRKQKEGLLEYE